MSKYCAEWIKSETKNSLWVPCVYNPRTGKANITVLIQIKSVHNSSFKGGRNWPGKSTKDLFWLMEMFCVLCKRVYICQNISTIHEMCASHHYQLYCNKKAESSENNTSVQFSRSVMSDSLRPHESHHARPPCPSPTPGVHPNPCPLSRWCHPTISSFVIPFSSCPQSFPASESFQMNQLFSVAKIQCWWVFNRHCF